MCFFLKGLWNHCTPFIYSLSSPATGVTVFSPGYPHSLQLFPSLPPPHCKQSQVFYESQSYEQMILSCLETRPLGKSWLGMIWWHRTLVSYTKWGWRDSAKVSRESEYDKGRKLHSCFFFWKCPQSSWATGNSFP